MNGVKPTRQMDQRLQYIPGAMVNRNPAYAMPTFGAAGNNQSPFAMADDLRNGFSTTTNSAQEAHCPCIIRAEYTQ
ncbi:hypothetical protein IG631_24075 [Alternaria alternata]|nr:hypothetical protein IG631_24075 [Alternaria alternata]